MLEIANPQVSVGLPVYNGEEYVGTAIESILNQDLADLELIISDNASNDRTESVCRKYASEDPRVIYIRRPYNIGGARNFNFVVEMARSRYFKWMAHDDVCHPSFLSRCLDVLEETPSAVLAYPRPVDIDEDGKLIGPRDQGLPFGHGRPYQRFRSTMTCSHAALPQFGVIRTATLRRTRLLGTYQGGDRPLLAELALHGRLVEVPEELFLHREHRDRSVYACRGETEMRKWWDPLSTNKYTKATWRRLGDYVARIRRSPAPRRDRLWSYFFMLRWTADMRKALAFEATVPLIRPLRRALRHQRL